MPPPAPVLRAHRCAYHDTTATLPFASAAEAWFWYMACHRVRLDGARTVAGMAAVSRPCEPGDIHRIVSRLYQAGSLRPRELAVLVRYGRIMLAPDAARVDKSRDVHDWQAALVCLDRALRARQIIA